MTSMGRPEEKITEHQGQSTRLSVSALTNISYGTVGGECVGVPCYVFFSLQHFSLSAAKLKLVLATHITALFWHSMLSPSPG